MQEELPTLEAEFQYANEMSNPGRIYNSSNLVTDDVTESNDDLKYALKGETKAIDPFENIERDMPAELREVMVEVARINEILKSAKTQTKKDVFKKKIAKLQKKAKMILFTQYLSGKHLPVESSQISAE